MGQLLYAGVPLTGPLGTQGDVISNRALPPEPGYEARHVHDWTDHVWTEVYSDSKERLGFATLCFLLPVEMLGLGLQLEQVDSCGLV